MSGLTRGAQNAEQGRRIYYNVSGGKFIRRVSEPTDTSKPRILEKGENAGKEVHEEHFDEIAGRLISVKVETNDWGKRWAFEIDTEEDGNGEVSIIQTPYSSGYASAILSRIPNLDLKKDVLFRGYKFRDKTANKERQGVTLYQNTSAPAGKIAPYYTKENPNGCPDMVKITVNGSEQWDSTERMKFFESMVEGLGFEPAPAAAPATAPAAPDTVAEFEDEATDEPPF